MKPVQSCTGFIFWVVAWDFQQCGMCDQQSLRSACAYAQSDLRLCKSLEYFMTVKLLTEHHLEFLSFKGGWTGLSESTLVKMPHCWKSHVTALLYNVVLGHRRSSNKLWYIVRFCDSMLFGILSKGGCFSKETLAQTAAAFIYLH